MKRIFVYMISTRDLPLATKEMNGYWDCFNSRVIAVKLDITDYESLVVVEHEGSYPFITNQWEKFIKPL